MALISQREYARRRGVSHVGVQRAVNSGRISTVDGKIDPAQADLEWRENTDQSKPRNRITGQPKRRRVPGEPSEPMDFGGGDELRGGNGTATGYARARAARELYQARLAKLDYEARTGQLVELGPLRAWLGEMVHRFRDRVLAIPDQLPGSLSPQDRERVRGKLIEALSELADEYEPPGR